MTDYVTDSAGRQTIQKDPIAVLDYPFDWTEWLDALGDTLALATVTGDGVTIDSTSIVGKVVVSFISGGTIGNTAKATCRVTTSGGRIDERTIYLIITER